MNITKILNLKNVVTPKRAYFKSTIRVAKAIKKFGPLWFHETKLRESDSYIGKEHYLQNSCSLNYTDLCLLNNWQTLFYSIELDFLKECFRLC